MTCVYEFEKDEYKARKLGFLDELSRRSQSRPWSLLFRLRTLASRLGYIFR